MPRVAWTPVAESDLDEILFYIAFVAFVDKRPETGERIFYEIRDRVNSQAEKNVPGRKHPQAPDDWEYFQHKRWLVFYKSRSDGIEVMRVIDGSRDLPRLLPG